MYREHTAVVRVITILRLIKMFVEKCVNFLLHPVAQSRVAGKKINQNNTSAPYGSSSL